MSRTKKATPRPTVLRKVPCPGGGYYYIRVAVGVAK